MGIVSRLRLSDFRSYSSLDIRFTSGINFLVGQNGVGKTNILEAIHYLALLRSFRTTRIDSLRKWGSGGFALSGTLLSCGDDQADQDRLVVDYRGRRRLAVNGVTATKASAFINRFICVTFIPEDIDLVKGSAGGRRRFMDILLSQIDPSYILDLQRYKVALKQRNAALKHGESFSTSAREAYDRLLVKHGAMVIVRRRRLIEQLNAVLAGISRELLHDLDGACLSLESSSSVLHRNNSSASFDEVCGIFTEVLRKGIRRDLDRGLTEHGPHRDDLKFYLGDNRLRDFGSEGECRIAGLGIRLASLEVIRRRERDGKGVVLLVDDVLGELDAMREKAFLDHLGSRDQIIISGTEIPAMLRNSCSKVIEIDGGADTGAVRVRI